MLDDTLNPKFVFYSPAPLGHHDLQEHIDRAIIALDGRAPLAGVCAVELLGAPTGGTLRVDLWVEDLDDFSCTYGFTVSSEEGAMAYARGERTVVNVDPRSHQRQPWSPALRATHESLMKDLPAYA